jgi:hypothetical protein
MDPLLIDVPERIATERLIVRVPRAGDGAAVNAAVRASHAELAPWMPWAVTLPSVDESEAHCRRAQATAPPSTPPCAPRTPSSRRGCRGR